jgi:hypothetical protein
MPKLPHTLKRLFDEHVFYGPKFGTKRISTVEEQEEQERKTRMRKKKRIFQRKPKTIFIYI